METLRWNANYVPARSGKKAAELVEPYKGAWGDFNTEEEAVEYFKKGLRRHVKLYKEALSSYSSMETLIKRLRKYNMYKEANEIEGIARMLKSIDG
jgi:hypothetical protein